MSRFQKTLLVLLILISAFLRLYKIEQIPVSMYYDEIDTGYQARSFLLTGKDYRGSFSPFYFMSSNDPRTPIPIYLAALGTAIFNTPELQLRVPSAVMGTLTVGLVYLWMFLLTKNYLTSLVVASMVGLSPWQLQFSRYSHEATSTVVLFMAGLICLELSVQRKRYKWLILSAIFLGLGIYTYRTMSMLVPLSVLTLGFFYWSRLKIFGVKKVLLAGLVSFSLIVPFLYSTTLAAADKPRISQLAITSDPKWPIMIQRDREVDSGDLHNPEIGKQASLSSFFFHNKILKWLGVFGGNFVHSFSPEFLVVNGDGNLRHAVGRMGMIYYLDLLAFFAGLYYLIRNPKLKYRNWLFVWLLMTAVPAAITTDGAGHGSRLFMFSIPLLIVIGLGWIIVFNYLKTLPFGLLIRLGLFSLIVLNMIYYFHIYYTHYPHESQRAFSYGYKQAMLKIAQEEHKYQHIAFAPTGDPPMIYYLFWANVHPKLEQEYGFDFGEKTIKNHPLDKYKIKEWEKDLEGPALLDFLQPDTLYLVTQDQIKEDLRTEPAPPGIKVIDIILYPDKEVFAYLITEDPEFDGL